MSTIPSRDNVHGSLNSVLAELKSEAAVLLKAPNFLLQIETPDNATQIAKALAVAKRVSEFHFSGVELASLFRVEVEQREEIVAKKLDRSPGITTMRWIVLGSVINSAPTSKAAAESEYAEAVEIIYAEEKAHAVLANVDIQSAAELQQKHLPPPRMNIETLLPEGIGKLSAPPKSGKSWAGLSLAVSTASGGLAFGQLSVVKGHALYLGLEDSYRRLQSRLERQGGVFPTALDIMTEIPKGVALVDLLEAWLVTHKLARLIVVDSLGRALRGVDLMDYQSVTAALDPIQRLAFKHGVTVLFIHHTRKGMSDGDVFDSSLGSAGIFGVMDVDLLLQRKRAESTAVLYITGREIGDASYSLELETSTMQWKMTNRPPEETLQSPERRAILDILHEAGPEGIRTSDIGKRLGRADSTVSTLLHKLKEEGLCSNPKYGKWKAIESIETVESERSIEGPRDEEGQSTFDSSDTFYDSSLPGEAEPSPQVEVEV